ERLPPRRAQPDRQGRVHVAIEAYVDDGTPVAECVEIPLPDGYMFDTDVSALALLPVTETPITLYYTRQPTLRVRTIDAEGAPVIGARVYAQPVIVSKKLKPWATSSSLVWGGGWAETESGWTAQDHELDKRRKDFTHWMRNPFDEAKPIQKFLFNYHGEEGVQDMHHATTASDGWCELPRLFAGTWQVIGFGGHLEDTLATVKLDHRAHELTLTMAVRKTARVVIDIEWQPKDLSDWSDYERDVELSRTSTDPRMFYDQEGWDGEVEITGTTGRVEFATTMASSWWLEIENATLAVDSTPGQTTHYNWIIIPDQDDGIWVPTAKLGDADWDGLAAIYRDGRLVDDVRLNDEHYFYPGKYRALLPADQWHEFTIVEGETLEETIIIPAAKLEIRVDKLVMDYLGIDHNDELEMNWGDHAHMDEGWTSKKLHDGTVFTRFIPTGYAVYEIDDKFRGSFNPTVGETIKLQFAKEACTGYSRLKVNDRTADGLELSLRCESKESWLTSIDPRFGEPRGMWRSWPDDDTVRIRDGSTMYFFAHAGPNVLEAFGDCFPISLPVTLPAVVDLTDQLLERDAARESGHIEFEVEEEDNWDYAEHAILEDGTATGISYGQMQWPVGAHALHLFRSDRIDDREVVQYGTYTLYVGTKDQTIRPSDFAWQDCLQVTLDFHGHGGYDDRAARWWNGHSVIIQQPRINCQYSVEPKDVVSEQPPIRRGKVWLPAGDFIVRAQCGSTPVVINKFKVTTNGPNKFIIKDKP
ncbi:hypothetical protein OAU50_04625, partial [Planctomycetota bacterium]|nr:hypothetical protein [Planctomycetota bacterium]